MATPGNDDDIDYKSEGGVFGTTGGGTYSGGLHEVDGEDEPKR